MSTKTGCFLVIISSVLCAIESLPNEIPNLETSVVSRYHGKGPLSYIVYAERHSGANIEYRF